VGTGGRRIKEGTRDGEGATDAGFITTDGDSHLLAEDSSNGADAADAADADGFVGEGRLTAVPGTVVGAAAVRGSAADDSTEVNRRNPANPARRCRCQVCFRLLSCPRNPSTRPFYGPTGGYAKTPRRYFFNCLRGVTVGRGYLRL
jgi:hypothetical protein